MSKLKRSGIGVVAALTLCLAITSLASAANFTASSYPASYNGEGKKGDSYFLAEGLKTECAVKATGALSAASSTLSATATFSECTAFGFLSATVVNTGCSYLMHVSSGEKDSYTGSGDVVCEAGKSVQVSAGTCKVEIPAQNGNVTLKYTNNTEEGTVEGEVTASNITFNVTQDGLACPFKGTGTKTGGEVSQVVPATIKVPEKTVDIG